MTTLADRPSVDGADEPVDPESQHPAPPRLFRRFVDQLLADDGSGGRASGDGGVAPEDWRSLWASASREATPEQALGRLALAAQRLAVDRRLGLVRRPPGAGTVDSPGTAEPPSGPVASPPSTAPSPPPPPSSPSPEGGQPAWALPAPPALWSAAPPASVMIAPTALLDRPPPTLEPAPAPLRTTSAPTTATGPPPPPSPATVALWEQQRALIDTVSVAPPPSREEIGLRRRQKLANAFGWVRNAGIVIILFAAWQVWGTSIAQHQAQQSLKAQFKAEVKSPVPARPGPVQLVSASVQEPIPPEGSVVAHLQIPAIGVDQYVVEGVAEGDLAKGPGHYAGTSMPGQAGNVAIAGHRTTYGAPFYDLGKLTPGDPITLTTDSGETLDYVVTQGPTVVSPTDVGVLDYFGDNRLTLTTCNPPFSSTSRLVVVALLRESAGTTPVAAPSGSKPESPKHRAIEAGSVQWNFGYLAPVLLVLALMVLLGFANQRAAGYFGRTGRWLVLVPVWGAVLYLLFGFLTNLLPSTL